VHFHEPKSFNHSYKFRSPTTSLNVTHFLNCYYQSDLYFFEEYFLAGVRYKLFKGPEQPQQPDQYSLEDYFNIGSHIYGVRLLCLCEFVSLKSYLVAGAVFSHTTGLLLASSCMKP